MLHVQARSRGRSLVRVSSTLFYHANPEFKLEAKIPGPKQSPTMLAGEFIERELEAIALPVAKELKAH